MAILSKGTDFATGDQVTATKLDNLVDNATFASGAVDNSTTQINGSGQLIVKDSGISTDKLATSTNETTGVTFNKLQQVAANTVLVRDANSTGAVSAKAVTDTQILIGDGTGFTAAALSGDATMTNAGVVSVGSVASGATGSTASTSDDSTKLATTAYVQANKPSSIAVYTVADGSLGPNSGTDVSMGNIPLTESSDPDNIGSVSGGEITLGAGTYSISYFGFYTFGGSTATRCQVRNKIGSSIIHQVELGSGSNSLTEPLSGTTYQTSSSNITASIQVQLLSGTNTTLGYENARIEVIKLG
jgi:hypothetical protein|tara:strand:+ start:139 stop:1044 length:906 start_codon:yes stop_codon:yes gene_type:complete